MQVSVVMTTYNAPAWLEKVLWGYSAQEHRDFEVIVADDGSTAETAAMIERMRAATGLDIRHVWQRDDGFRKCRILNKAILHARGEYLVFTDGDCIPRKDFLAEHVRHATPGHYLCGSYCKLSMPVSEAITRDDILEQRCFDIAWLRAHGLPRRRKDLKLAVPRRYATLLHWLSPTRHNFKGANASAWRADVLRINGFDERMVWGGLDREFGVRLRNAGVRSRPVRYSAICIHLDHARGYRDQDAVEANKQLRKTVARDGRVETDYGIRQLQESGYEVRL